jgi:hypothetical protein
MRRESNIDGLRLVAVMTVKAFPGTGLWVVTSLSQPPVGSQRREACGSPARTQESDLLLEFRADATRAIIVTQHDTVADPPRVLARPARSAGHGAKEPGDEDPGENFRREHSPA